MLPGMLLLHRQVWLAVAVANDYDAVANYYDAVANDHDAVAYDYDTVAVANDHYKRWSWMRLQGKLLEASVATVPVSGGRSASLRPVAAAYLPEKE